MKKLLFFLLLLLFSFFFSKQTVNAQSFPSIFGHASTSWVYAWYNLDFGGIDSIYVSGDEMAGGKSYKRIKGRWANSGFQDAYLREDTLAGKVWYRNVSGDTTEYLAYQYGLLPGDSFNVNYNYGSAGNADLYQMPWARVDSVKIKNGLSHVYFNVNLYGEPLAMVEGIGYSTGIIYNYKSGIMGGQYLLCSYKDGVKTAFENKRYQGNCRPPMSIASMASKEVPQVSISPNPVKEVLNITTKAATSLAAIRVCNALGQQVFMDNRPDNAYTINTAQWPAGIYYLRCLLNGGAGFTQTITVAH